MQGEGRTALSGVWKCQIQKVSATALVVAAKVNVSVGRAKVTAAGIADKELPAAVVETC